MTPEQKDWYNKNVFNTPEAKANFMAKSPEEQQQYMSQLSQAQSYNRDATLNASYQKTQYDSQMADAKAQVEMTNRKALDNLNSQVNNFAVAQGTAGR